MTLRPASAERLRERYAAVSVTVAEGSRSKTTIRRLGEHALADTLGTRHSDPDHLAAGVLHPPLL